MIEDIINGDILSRDNPRDVIIGMNTQLDDVLGIGKRFVQQIRRTREIRLGSVITFDIDGARQLHMIVCHLLGKGGWTDSEKYIRYGMDYLWHTHAPRKFSIVQIGNGRVGRRDGADPGTLRTAIASSFLKVNLYVYDDHAEMPAEATGEVVPFRPLRIWDIVSGEAPIQAMAEAA